MFIFPRSALHPRVLLWFGHRDHRCGDRVRAAVVDCGSHGDGAAVLGAVKDEPVGLDFLVHGTARNGPGRLQFSRSLGAHRREIVDHRNNFNGLPSIPARRRFQRDDRFRNVFRDRDRDVPGLYSVRKHGLALQRQRGVRRHSTSRQREGKPVHRRERFHAVPFESPINLLRSTRLGHDHDALAFQHFDRGFAQGKFRALLHDGADQRLHGVLIFVLQLHPVRRTGDARDPHLVNVADVTEVCPAHPADAHHDVFDDRHRGLVVTSAIEPAVHVDFIGAVFIGCGDVIPLSQDRHRRGTGSAGPVGSPAQTRGRADVEAHFIAVTRFAIEPRGVAAPVKNRRPRQFRTEPRLRSERAIAERIVGDVRAAENALAAREMTRLADEAGGSGRALILGRERFEFIPQRPVHVQHAHVAVLGIEHRRTFRLGRGIRLSPMNFNLLPVVAFDLRDEHPDVRRSVRGIPLLDLIRERRARAGRETNVLPVRLRLAEIKKVLVQPHQ